MAALQPYYLLNGLLQGAKYNIITTLVFKENLS